MIKSAISVSLFGLICLVSLLLGAASGPVQAQDDLDRLINGMQAKYGNLRGLAADFTQNYRDPSGRNLLESGRFLLKRPNKMRWEYTTPERKLFISDGRKLYFYLPDEKQVTVSSIKEGSDPRTPFLFLLRRSNLRRDFERITFATESPVFAGDRVLLMVPRNAPANFRQMVVELNPSNFQIRRVTSIDAAGTQQTFTFSNIQENPSLADGQFQFTVPSGVRVIQGS